MVFTLKMWQKIISAVLVVVLIGAAVWYFSQEQKECCLCSSFRFHAPCLVDLETGEMIELDLYFPHETKVAELADPQPEMGTFSFVRLGDVAGTKLTDSKTIELDIPTDSIRAYNEAGFSPCEPPVLIDESTVLVSYERLLEIKAADKNKTPSKAKKDESEEKNYNDQADYPVLDAQLPF